MSVLDDRIRRIAGEVTAGFADGIPGSSDRVAALEQTVAELSARVDELEKAAAAPAKRAPRKTAAETTE
ncbi:MAG: hypothetical protein HOY75_13075 [Streptomyces sp.]|nr:hypothetical protein [Streptomyces sp.]